MKTTLLLTLSILTSNIMFAQTTNCAAGKIGKFELNSPTSGKTIIIRTELNQTELNDSLNYEATFDVKWVDNCTYELRNKKLIKGDIRLAGQPTDIIQVKILKIEGDKIYIKSSSNYSDQVVERVITKLK